MTCNDCRRAAMIDPDRVPAQVLAHVAECAACRHLLGQARADLTSIARAVATTEVPPLARLLPPELTSPRPADAPARVVAAAGFRPARRRWLAAAASVMAGAAGSALVLRQTADDGGDAELARALALQLDQAPTHLLPADPAIAVNAGMLFRALGLQVLGDLPALVRCGSCTIDGVPSAQLVFDWQSQRAVAFVIRRSGTGRTALAAGKLRGELRPMVGGMLGVLASRPDQARALADRLVGELAWLG